MEERLRADMAEMVDLRATGVVMNEVKVRRVAKRRGWLKIDAIVVMGKKRLESSLCMRGGGRGSGDSLPDDALDGQS